jgi:4-hydroxy-L-threonine phosphate dehydrogenase PdxA
MHRKPIIIVPGQPKSIFFEIFFKSLNIKKIKSPLILVCSVNLFNLNAKKYKLNKKINLINSELTKIKLINNYIYILDIKLKKSISSKTQLNYNKQYLKNCFDESFKLLKKNFTYKFLNGPINKKDFLGKDYLGITEYISNSFNQKKTGMLIYNNKLSVCPLTTHLPIKLVAKKISKSLVQNKIKIINDFYIDKLKFKPKIAVTGLNPHCESISSFNEDERIILPAIKFAKKNGISVSGPYPADTIFLEQNRKKFDVILGMYHDQVLTPLKTLYEYDAINITMGLPFIRVSPDHGPNEKMVNKNISNPTSLFKALEFLDNN